jgi:hypothetical protein
MSAHAQRRPDVLTITPAGHAALERVAAHLAAAIDTSTPATIAKGLAALYRLEVTALLDAEPEPPAHAGGVAGRYPPLTPATDRGYADGRRMQLPG